MSNDVEHVCFVCGTRTVLVCSGCKAVWYCSQRCQRHDYEQYEHEIACDTWRALLLAAADAAAGATKSDAQAPGDGKRKLETPPPPAQSSQTEDDDDAENVRDDDDLVAQMSAMDVDSRYDFGADATYFATLGLPPTANEDDVRAAYRAAALRFHPDKAGSSELALSHFKAINRAYHKLIALFRGEKGPPDEAIARYLAKHAARVKGERERARKLSDERRRPPPQQGDSAKPPSPFTEYAERHEAWFGAPIARSLSEPAGSVEEMRDDDDEIGGTPGGGGDAAVIYASMHCTLEQLYRGGDTVAVQYEAQRYTSPTAFGGGATVGASAYKAALRTRVTVRRGWRDGQRLLLRGLGNERAPGVVGDLVVTVVEEPHERFARRDDDLYVSVERLPFAAALFNNALVTTLDGRRQLVLQRRDPSTRRLLFLRAGTELRFEGEGMPVHRRGDDSDANLRFGALIVNIATVDEPPPLTDAQAAAAATAFPNGAPDVLF
jgi:hypothetical protein